MPQLIKAGGSRAFQRHRISKSSRILRSIRQGYIQMCERMQIII